MSAITDAAHAIDSVLTADLSWPELTEAARAAFTSIDVEGLARSLDPRAFEGGAEDYGAWGDRQRAARRVAQTCKAHLLREGA